MFFKNANRILIVRLSSLGDILLTTPVIRSIKNLFPDIQIDFMLRKEYGDLMKFNPYLKELYLYINQRDDIKDLQQRISGNNYDFVIDLQNNFRSRKFLKPITVPKFSFKKRNVKKFLLVHFKINSLSKSLSIPERYAQTLNEITLDNRGLDLITRCEPDMQLANNNNLIGFCPGSKHFTKMWPIEYFILLGKLLEQNGYTVVLFGGREDHHVCEEILYNLKTAINLCSENDILQTAADMKTCKVVYCNDSGLMHTATAVDIPVITFFGSTVREFGFSPYNCLNLILENNSLTCRPCTHIGRKDCPKKHFNCMKQILPQTAFDSLNSILDK